MGPSTMIYFLANPDHRDKLLIGTAPEIAETRRTLAAGGLTRAAYHDVSGREKGLPLWLRRLECVGMTEGGEAEAEVLREQLWPETYREAHRDLYKMGMPDSAGWEDRCRRVTPWRVASDYRGWLAAHAGPWDGSEAQTMGVKGLGRKRYSPARTVSIRERLARRRSGQ
jgi:hypothetical protein